MSSFLILLTLSALSGFVLGLSHFSWRAIVAAGAVLAPLSAVVLQNQGFGALSGIAITVACLVINQAAYVVGAIRVNDGPTSGSVLPSQRADNEPHDDRTVCDVRDSLVDKTQVRADARLEMRGRRVLFLAV